MNLPKAIPSRQKRQEIDILDLAPIKDIEWVTKHFDADDIHRIFCVNPYLLTNSQIRLLKQMLRQMRATRHNITEYDR